MKTTENQSATPYMPAWAVALDAARAAVRTNYTPEAWQALQTQEADTRLANPISRNR